MIGFKPNQINRTAINNCQGNRVGYLCSENGKQVLRNPEGQKIAVITKWKNGISSRTSACGGTMIYP
jgi:hypothetical protein